MSFVTVGRTRAKNFVQAVLSQDAASLAAQEAEIARRVRAEVQRQRGEALAEARAQGEAEARAAMAPLAARLEASLAAFDLAAAQLAAPLAQKEQELAGLVVELAALLAGHYFGAPETARVDFMRQLVTRLLAEAAAECHPRQTVLLRLNPAEQQALAAPGWGEAITVLADASIAPGGARVELITPEGDPFDRTEWDATLEGRLERLHAALALPERP